MEKPKKAVKSMSKGFKWGSDQSQMVPRHFRRSKTPEKVGQEEWKGERSTGKQEGREKSLGQSDLLTKITNTLPRLILYFMDEVLTHAALCAAWIKS